MTTSTLPVLYSFRRCPYAMRARMALRYASIDIETVEVSLRDKPAALLALSPKATVPVLHLPSGEVIDQSLEIMHWALRQSDPDGWLQATPLDAVQHWVALNDGPFKRLLDRYKYAERHTELTQAQHLGQALETFIRPLDAALRATPYLLGMRPSLADVALFPFVRQFAMVDAQAFDQLPLPGVQRWLAAWLESALFEAVMVKAVATAGANPRT